MVALSYVPHPARNSAVANSASPTGAVSFSGRQIEICYKADSEMQIRVIQLRVFFFASTPRKKLRNKKNMAPTLLRKIPEILKPPPMILDLCGGQGKGSYSLWACYRSNVFHTEIRIDNVGEILWFRFRGSVE